MITAGIDVGSTTTKAVVLDGEKIIGEMVIDSGINPSETAREVFERCCKNFRVDKSKITAIAVTGYGRRMVNFGDMVITEIKACALGSKFIECSLGKVNTIIDIGGQDTKVISLNEKGDIEDFSMNDKCAAGTGRFLEVLAKKLEFGYEDFINAALNSKTMIHMNSTCAVFAESEVISLLAKGVDKKDIAAAAHNAIAERVASMVRRVGAKEIVCFTGGGALNKALASALEEALNKKIFIPKHAQTIVALGAALAAQGRVASL